MEKELLRQIQVLKCEGLLKEALKLANKGFKKTKDNCFLNETYDCLMKMNNRKGAIKILEKMLKREPKNLVISKRLGYNYFWLGNFKKALKHYKYALEWEPLSAANYFNVGSMHHYLNNHETAEFYYRTALKLDPKDISVIDNLAVLYYETGKTEMAITLFQQAIANFPNHPEAYHHMGVYFRDHKSDFELAECYIKKAIHLDPPYFENYYQLALTYAKEGKIDEALELTQKCLDRNPKHKGCLNLMKDLKKA